MRLATHFISSFENGIWNGLQTTLKQHFNLKMLPFFGLVVVFAIEFSFAVGFVKGNC